MNWKKDWKKNFEANYMQLLLVFIAFLLMVQISYLSISDIVQKHLNERAVDALHIAEANAELGLRESELALTSLVQSIRDAVEKNASQEELDSLFGIASAWMRSNEQRSPFILYGIIRGEPMSSSIYSPYDIPRRLAWFGAQQREKSAFSPDAIIYSEPYTNVLTGRLVVTAARGVYDRTGHFIGVVATDIDTGRLYNYFSRFRSPRGGYGILLNDRMIVIAHPKKELLGRYLRDIRISRQDMADRMAADGEFVGLHTENTDGEAVVLSVRRMFNGWYIGTIIPFHVYYRDVYQMAAILSVVGFILAFCLCYILLRLSAARMRSDEESRSKSSALATISHEIRTPLNAIIGLSEIELGQDLSARTRENLEKILASGSNLLAIINDILDISKIVAGHLDITPTDFDVPLLINDVVQLNIVRIGSKNIIFDLQIDEATPRKLHGDELRVKQILNNLLSNAFKYTQAGTVSFQIRCRRDKDSAALQFIVQDTGVGIEKEDLGKLFQEYSQLNSRPDRSIEGTGLGLSITRNLVELMGGTIAVRSKYGEGSRFTVLLRLKIADETPIGPETANDLRTFRFMDDRGRKSRGLVLTRSLQGKVLVVDDVATNLDVAKGFIAPYGLTVDCVLSGQKALEIVRAISDDAPAAEKYDIIFMDHMMPEMDGIEAVHAIRALGTEYARAVPVVALTANALTGNDAMFLQNGFNDFLPKPIDLFRLDAILNKWIHAGQTVIQEQAWEQPPLSPAKLSPANEAGVLDGLSADGIDIEAGIRCYAGSAAYLPILRSYVLHTPDLLETLRSEKQRLETLFSSESPSSVSRPPSPEDMRKYAIAVHGLKGSSFGVKANSVGKAAEKLEHAAKAGDWEAVRAGNDALLETAKGLLVRLEEILKTAAARLNGTESDEKGGQEKERRAAPDPALLEQLLSAARCSKTSQMEELIAELERCDYDSGMELVAWLRERVENLEYDDVANRLENELNL